MEFKILEEKAKSCILTNNEWHLNEKDSRTILELLALNRYYEERIRYLEDLLIKEANK